MLNLPELGAFPRRGRKQSLLALGALERALYGLLVILPLWFVTAWVVGS